MITFTQLGKMGRLGNICLQASTCIALADRNNDQYIFPYFDGWENFNLGDCFSNNIKPTHTWKEPGFEYTEISFKDTKNKVLDIVGFCQSYKYFDDRREIILEKLTPQISFGTIYDTASIHVRHGDYLELTDCYAQLDMNYYNKAMEIMNAGHYLVFSDDINWCKKNFIGEQFTIVEDNPPHIDMAMMAACEKGNIIANSSFSYFAAYVNQHLDRKVVFPVSWFGPKLPFNIKDLCPPNWIKIY